MNLTIRDLEEKDVNSIVQYWDKASPELLDTMGVDPSKLPPSDKFRKLILSKIGVPDKEKTSCVLVWEVDGKAIGFNNLAPIRRGESASIHLHIWDESYRGRGFGTHLMSLALRHYFKRFKLKMIDCQPKASNPGPNRLLQKLGLQPTKVYRTIGSPIMYETEVARYEIHLEFFDKSLQLLLQDT